MDSKQRSILVMDANQRSALAATRALGRHYGSVVTADSTPASLAGQSKYSSQYLVYPCPTSDPDGFINWVAQHCLDSQYDLIVPTTEVTSQLILISIDQLPGLPLAFANYETVMTIANKSNLVKAALASGVPVPESAFYSQLSELDGSAIDYPVVLKPSLSKIFEDGHWTSTTVRILRSDSDLQKIIQSDTYLQKHSFMIQEFIPGHGAGLFCLYDKGKAVQYFAHQRIREKPPEGGVSVLSQAAPLDETLKTYATTLLDSVNWHGVAMVEFRIADNGMPYLMEVNTRFWGSLQLAIDSGVNFPVQLASAHFGEPVVSSVNYNENQRLRWLMGDIDSLYIYLKGSYSLWKKLKRIGWFLIPKVYNQKHEINRLYDMKPFWAELKQYFKAL